MGYVRQLGDASDTDIARALHSAALAVIAARNSGNAAALSAATKSFNAQAGTNDERVQALKVAESTPTGFLANLQSTLTGAGKWAALGIAVIVLAPHLLGALAKAGRHPMRLNPGRRRRRGRKRGR